MTPLGGLDDGKLGALIPLSPRKQVANRDRTGFGQFVTATAPANVGVVVPHDLARVPQGVMVFDSGAAPQPRLTVLARTRTSITVSGDVAMAGVVLYIV